MMTENNPRYLDPANKISLSGESTESVLPDDRSYLGRFADNGWSIMIEPKLTKEEWDSYSRYGHLTWNSLIDQWDINLALKLLGRLFPRHRFTILLPEPPDKKREKK